MTKLLIELGSDVNIEDKHRQTPIFYAAKNGKTEVCGILLDGGANINHEDEKQMTPVIIAQKSRKFDVSS